MTKGVFSENPCHLISLVDYWFFHLFNPNALHGNHVPGTVTQRRMLYSNSSQVSAENLLAVSMFLYAGGVGSKMENFIVKVAFGNTSQPGFSKSVFSNHTLNMFFFDATESFHMCTFIWG